MCSAYYVAIALLVAIGGQTAAKFDQDKRQYAPNDDVMTSADTVNKTFQSRILQGSRNPKDDLMHSADDEERTPLDPSKSLTHLGVSHSIISAANALRTEREANAIKAGSKNLKQLESNKRHRIASTLNKLAGRVGLESDKFRVSVANDKPLILSKRRTRKRPAAVMKNAARSVTQHDYHFAPFDSSLIDAEAPNSRLYNQLIHQKALQLDKNEHHEQNWQEDDLVSFDLLHLFENSAHPTAGNRREVSASEPASKQRIQLESKKRKRIIPTLNNVVGRVVRSRPDPDKFPVSVAMENPSVSTERLKTKHPTAILENSASFLKQHDSQLAPSKSSTLDPKAPDDRLHNQLITHKAPQLDKDGPVDKSAHPTAVNHQEESVIEVPSKSLNQLEGNANQRIDSTSTNVVEEVVHASPDPDKFLVLLASNLPSLLAERLRIESPTPIINNAARFLKQHYDRLAHFGLSTTNAKAPSGRVINQPIAQKALQLDKNQHFDNVKNLRKADPHTADHLLQLRGDTDESAHPMTMNRQTVPENWLAEYTKGPLTFRRDALDLEVRTVHAAFLETFNLPFHQYPQETAFMLRAVRWQTKSSPNNIRIFETFKDLADRQKKLSDLQILLSPDLKKLLGDGKMAVPTTLKNLQEAFTVKLVIMYELFFNFCHERKDLVGRLPSKREPPRWILKLSTNGNENRQILHSHGENRYSFDK